MRRLTPTVPGLVTGLLLAATACTGGPAGAGPEPAEEGAAAQAAQECGDHAVPLARTLSTGLTWSLCLHVDAKRGMVLRDVGLTPTDGARVRIAEEVALAQLEVPYDTGERTTSDITSAGFGGLKMQTLTATECTGELLDVPVPTIGDGSRFGEIPERAVLCSEVADAGLAYRSAEDGLLTADRHDAWTLSTVSKVGWYEYVSSYRLGSDASLRPELGATGDLSPVDFTDDGRRGWPVGPEGDSGSHAASHAASHAHNAAWRIHWALDDGTRDGAPLRVEQYDATPTGGWGSTSPVLDGRLRPITHPATARRADRRWWRVVAPGSANRDGHPLSYEISLGASDGFIFTRDQRAHGADAGYDVAFTNADDCQLVATENRGGCGGGVLDFVADGRGERLADVVSWVAVGFHHVPRDEDQSPMQLHWQGFALLPRDLTAQRLDVPDGREQLNGQPETWNGEMVEDLVSP